MSAFIRHRETTERPLPLNQTIHVVAQRVALLAALALPACTALQQTGISTPVLQIDKCDDFEVEKAESVSSCANENRKRFKISSLGVRVSDFPYMNVFADGTICALAKEISDNQCWNSEMVPLPLTEQQIDDRRAQLGWAPETNSVFREGAKLVYNSKGGAFHVDRAGKPLYSQTYDAIKHFHEGAAVVINWPYRQHIDKTGRPLYKWLFEDAKNFHEGAAAVKLNGKWFHIDKRGQEFYKERYDSCFLDGGLDFHDGIASACLDGKQFHINKAGKSLYPERYEFVGYRFQEGVARVSEKYTYPGEKYTGLDGPAYHIDKRGRRIYETSYEWVGDFSESLAGARSGARTDSKYFHIDKSGEPAYSERFDLVHDFHNGVTVGRRGDKWYLLKVLQKYEAECDAIMTTLE